MSDQVTSDGLEPSPLTRLALIRDEWLLVTPLTFDERHQVTFTSNGRVFLVRLR